MRFESPCGRKDIVIFKYQLAFDIHAESALSATPPPQLSEVQFNIVRAIRDIERIAETAFRQAQRLIEELIRVGWVERSRIGKGSRCTLIPPAPRSIWSVREPELACSVLIVGIRSAVHEEFDARLVYDR
jgi:phosphate uptake regulator